MGIMSYLSSPLWFLFLLFGLGIALWREFFPPEYFSDTKTLFPLFLPPPGLLLLPFDLMPLHKIANLAFK